MSVKKKPSSNAFHIVAIFANAGTGIKDCVLELAYIVRILGFQRLEGLELGM